METMANPLKHTIMGKSLDTKKMKILNYKEFDQCFEHYKTLFPDTFTKMDEIIKILNQDYEETGGSGPFGIQVADDWEDRYYGFEFAGDTPYPKYKFVGMTKS